MRRVAIVSDAQAALQLVKQNPNTEVWAEDGGYVDSRHVVFYVTQGENNVFLREAELKALEKSIKESQTIMAEKEQELQVLNAKSGEVDSKRYELDRAIRREEMKLVEVNFAFQRAKSDRDKTQSDREKLEQEVQAAEAAIQRHQDTLDDLFEKHGQAQEEAEQHKQRSTELHQEVEARSGALREEQDRLKEKESSLKEVIDQHRKVVHSLNVLEVQDLESIQQQQRLEQEVEVGQALQDQIQAKLEQDAELLQDVEKALEEVVQASSQLEHEVSTHKQAIKEVELTLDSAREEIKRCETQLYEVGMEMTQVVASIESIKTN